jgi:hypothetical protein
MSRLCIGFVGWPMPTAWLLTLSSVLCVMCGRLPFCVLTLALLSGLDVALLSTATQHTCLCTCSVHIHVFWSALSASYLLHYDSSFILPVVIVVLDRPFVVLQVTVRICTRV